LPTGFDKGFKPDIPTKEEVEAVKQKQAQAKADAIAKDPNYAFKEGAKQDDAFLTFNKTIIADRMRNEAQQGKISEETKAMLDEYNNYAGRSIEDFTIAEDFSKTYGKDPRFMAGFARKAADYSAIPLNQRPPAKEYFKVFETNPEEVLDINIDSADFVKNLGEQEYQKAVKNSVGGVTIDKETLLKSKFPNGQVDELTMSAFKADPARMKTIDANRRKSEAATINSLFGKGNKVKARVRSINPDGTENITEQTYTNPEELTQLVTNGEAIPLDSKGRPIQGFEDGFGLLAVDKRNNRVATNYLTTAAGITRKNETATVIDEDKAGVRDGFGFGINTRKNISLTKGTQNDFVQLTGLSQQLKNAGLSEDEINRAQSVRGDVLIPSVISDGKNEPIKIGAVKIPTTDGVFIDSYIGDSGKTVTISDKVRSNQLSDVQVINAEPITTNSNGSRILIPENLDAEEKVNYLSQRTGTNNRGQLKTEVVLNLATENPETKELQPISYRVKDATDPLWLKFVQTTLPAKDLPRVREKAKIMYDKLYKSNKDQADINAAVNIQRKQAPIKKTNKPKAKVSL
jgi:hypothetical protein